MINRFFGVALEWAGEHDADLALRRAALGHHAVDDARGRPDADVAPRFLALECGQAAEVALDERLDRRQIEAADEDEREVAGVGEAVLVERHRFLEAHLRDGVRGQRPRAQVILADRGGEGVLERRFGQRLPVGQRRGQLRGRRAERFGVGARLRERQIDQLEHRFDVPAQRPSVQPLGQLVDTRTHERGLAGELLAQIDGGQLAEPSLRDDLIGRLGGNEIAVRRE